MKVPKEIAKKIERYEIVKKESDMLYEEIVEWFNEKTDADTVWINEFGISQEHEGKPQGDGEYCDQCMSGEDSGSGTYYHQIENSTKYAYYTYYF